MQSQSWGNEIRKGIGGAAEYGMKEPGNVLGFMGIQCTQCPLGLSNPIYVTVVATDFFFFFLQDFLIRPEGCPRSVGPVSFICRQLHLGHWLSQHQLLVVLICKCILEILQYYSGAPCHLGEMQNAYFLILKEKKMFTTLSAFTAEMWYFLPKTGL